MVNIPPPQKKKKQFVSFKLVAVLGGIKYCARNQEHPPALLAGSVQCIHTVCAPHSSVVVMGLTTAVPQWSQSHDHFRRLYSYVFYYSNYSILVWLSFVVVNLFLCLVYDGSVV